MGADRQVPRPLAHWPVDDFDPLFIFYLMTFWADHVRKQASPSPVPILSKGAFERIEVFSSVDRGEQREIAAILATIDRKIDLHKRKRAVLDQLFAALLHKLMGGEIGITDLDLSGLTPKELEAAE
jgi:type I restriction enzyme S subunit